jgi:hypothetical protein
MMKPVKAFLYQDHQAHITVHMSAMKDPKIMQLVGQNPQAQMLQSAMLAHINEHIAYEYRKQMEAAMGIELPSHPDDEDAQGIPAEMEVQISQLAAQAAQQILQRNTNEVAAQQAQQAQQDPIIQMQQQELQLKAQEVSIKERKLAADAAAKADQLEIEEKRIMSQERIAGLQASIKAQKDNQDRLAKQEEAGAKLGVDMAKTYAQMQKGEKPNK